MYWNYLPSRCYNEIWFVDTEYLFVLDTIVFWPADSESRWSHFQLEHKVGRYLPYYSCMKRNWWSMRILCQVFRTDIIMQFVFSSDIDFAPFLCKATYFSLFQDMIKSNHFINIFCVFINNISLFCFQM